VRKHVSSTALGAAGLFLIQQTWPPSDYWSYWACTAGVGFVLLAILEWWHEQNKLNPKTINVCLARAHSFPYRGATMGGHYGDTYRIIDAEYPIPIDDTKAKDKVRFAFGIDIGKENAGIPLTNAKLNLEFKQDDRLEVTAEAEDGVISHSWQCHLPNHYYWYAFSKPIIERWANTWNTISIQFPKPGMYMLTFTITGEGIPAITKQARIEVQPPFEVMS